MNRRQQILLACVGIALLAGALVWAARPREPVYEGRRLTDWVEQYWNGVRQNDRSAETALRAMGTNAVPALIRMLDAKDAKPVLWLKRVALRQSLIPWEPIVAKERTAMALTALSALGELSLPALPKMRELFLAGERPETIAANAIRHCDPESVSFFSGGLTNPNPRIRWVSAVQLGLLGEVARPAVPTLCGSLGDTDRTVRAYSARALGLIGDDSGKVIPLLCAALQDSDCHVRRCAAAGIGEYGIDAQEAVDPLVRLTRDPNESVRMAATMALERVKGSGRGAIRQGTDVDRSQGAQSYPR